jgi:hypothetical protein
MGDASTTTPPPLSIRTATVERITNETKIKATLALDVHPSAAPQVISVKTGIGFLDHVSVAVHFDREKDGLTMERFIDASRTGETRRNVTDNSLRWGSLDR